MKIPFVAFGTLFALIVAGMAVARLLKMRRGALHVIGATVTGIRQVDEEFAVAFEYQSYAERRIAETTYSLSKSEVSGISPGNHISLYTNSDQTIFIHKDSLLRTRRILIFITSLSFILACIGGYALILLIMGVKIEWAKEAVL